MCRAWDNEFFLSGKTLAVGFVISRPAGLTKTRIGGKFGDTPSFPSMVPGARRHAKEIEYDDLFTTI